MALDPAPIQEITTAQSGRFPQVWIRWFQAISSVIAEIESSIEDILSDVTDFEKYLGIQDIVIKTAGTWTTTRVAQGDYVLRKTITNDTTIISLDVTEQIRTATDKGFKIDSIAYIFRNTTEDLDAHSFTLDRVEYADSTPISVNSISLTGSLGVGQDADPQIDTLTVDSSAFNNVNNSKYVIELTVDSAATSVYDFIGFVLKFTRNDLN